MEPGVLRSEPAFVLKAGYPAWAPLGEGNATVEGAEPTRYRPDFGGSGAAAASLSATFVSAQGWRIRRPSRDGAPADDG